MPRHPSASPDAGPTPDARATDAGDVTRSTIDQTGPVVGKVGEDSLEETQPRPRSTRWHFQLIALALVGLVLRIGYVFLYRRHAAPTGDAFFYHYQANLLVAGKWFVNPYQYFYFGHTVPAADHPPLWTLVLALASLVGVKSFFAQILWSCVVGALAVWPHERWRGRAQG